jgi:hypothetical protein
VIKTVVDPDRIEVVWVGDHVSTDVSYGMIFGDAEAAEDGVDQVKRMLQDKGILYRPW